MRHLELVSLASAHSVMGLSPQGECPLSASQGAHAAPHTKRVQQDLAAERVCDINKHNAPKCDASQSRIKFTLRVGGGGGGPSLKMPSGQPP